MDAPHAAILPILVVAVMPLAGCSQPIAITPVVKAAPAADDAPLIGRLRTRDQTVDLTRISIANGGPAEDLARGVARVMADVDRERVRASPSVHQERNLPGSRF